ncbi:hypothetical protein ACFWG0_26610 [Streptomyces yangpuensis]|uniref:hypothetical protein n=1 Tax=Streptomyces yangpuensis TaxID=1648182 RepID=UPI0036657C42
MSHIMPAESGDTNPTTREDAAGLRELANWLDANPDVPFQESRLLLALSTNPAVVEFAERHGWPVAYDDEGNASADRVFGPVTFHAYGYADFAAHLAVHDERQARDWAAKQGLEIVAPEGGAR